MEKFETEAREKTRLERRVAESDETNRGLQQELEREREGARALRLHVQR